MIAKHKKSSNLANTLWWMLAGFIAFGFLLFQLLQGKNIAILNSKGVVASQQRSLLLYALSVVLAVAVPTVVLLYFTAWRYRESHRTATYRSEAQSGRLFNAAIWAIPSCMVLLLAMTLIPATKRLQPNKALAAEAKPITIEVIAMRWKWLFIYPEQNIATVNFVEVPKNVPVKFYLTADEAPMSSFWVPNLSGQLYAMTGHVNQLNVMGTELGDFRGRSAEINGEGFAGMQFTARVTNAQDFSTWVDATKASAGILDRANYKKLVAPSQNNPATNYYPVDNTLYASTVMKYMGSHDNMMNQEMLMNDQTMSHEMSAGGTSK